MSIGALAFLSPWLLAALAALPVIYWLLRTVPPRPRQIAFPPTRILVGLENKDKTPAKTPWWLTLIRMLAAAFVIFALADPVLNPTREAGLSGSGPLVLVVDNGWSSGGHFAQRTRLVDQLISEAENANRPVVIAPTASGAKTLTLRVEAPGAARTTAAALQPQPFAPDRAALAEQLARVLDGQKGLDVVWLSDGIDHDGKTSAFATALSQIASGGRLQVIRNRAGDEPLGLSAGLDRDGRLEAFVVRAEGAGRTGTALAFSARNQRLAETPYEIPAGSRRISARFDLPLELRNQVARIELAGERSAGAVHLLDSRSRWHRIALISGESREQAQPLLAPLYYIERALAPFAELVRQKDVNLAGAVAGAFEQRSSVLVMADIGTIAGDLGTRVQEWVNKGGVLVRFAGPRLEKGGDDLLPVGLRMGGRTLGGALSWSTPQPLAPFEDSSLFAGLTIPRDVAVNRQILADPAYLTDEVSVWARLADGTPLVTARRMGEGQIVLFHITANSDWSNLPLSGLFVEMLRRIATLGVSGGIAVGGPEVMAAPTTRNTPAPETAEVLAPTQVLDGFGTLRPPTPTAQAIPARQIDTATPSLDHPPGYYGPTASPRALNVITPRTELRPLPSLPPNVEQRTYEGTNPEPLKPWLLSAALALIFADIVAVLLLQGLLRRRPRLQPAATASALLLAVAAALVLTSGNASAQRRPEARPAAPPTAAMPSSRDLQIAIQATGKVSFAYVLTGDAATDDASRAGLVGIGRHLSTRTSVEPGEPFGVNVTTDEIAFFPILYWPVLPNANPLPDATLAKIDTYMKQGGMIIFDTRDFGSGIPTGIGLGREGGTPLQRLIGRLDIPRLEPVPETHVLTKSFYILRSFPGRWDGGQMWVEADSAEQPDGDTRKARRADGVSSILVTPNDLAAAWALDSQNRPMFPVVPGGEAQREMSIRVGINIAMYALTGNYKADQVHAPALIERLGQ